MKSLSVLVGGLLAGLIIVAGEAVLNLGLLAEEWAKTFSHLGLPEPSVLVAVQGLIKLLVLGIFSVWLAVSLRRSFGYPSRAAVVAGLIIWFLVWAWVQWGMLLAGYVTPVIAVQTVAWGFIELPFAVWVGTWVQSRVMARLSRAEHESAVTNSLTHVPAEPENTTKST